MLAPALISGTKLVEYLFGTLKRNKTESGRIHETMTGKKIHNLPKKTQHNRIMNNY